MPNGLVLLHKPAGLSSHRALGPIKRSLGTRKVGHTGTLDPFAEGLMVVLVGRATKLAKWISPLGKCYRGIVRIGIETDTLDVEGTPVGEGPLVTFRTIEESLPSFLGTIQQIPPVYSAVHVSGERSYNLARKGEAPDLPPRTVVIDTLDVEPIDDCHFSLSVCCSSGTYIRALARDIARAAGTVGYLTHLSRLSVGPFFDSQAVEPDDVSLESVVPIEDAVTMLPGLRAATVGDSTVARVRNGGKLTDRDVSQEGSTGSGVYSLHAPDGSVLAIAERSDSGWTYHTVFN